MKQETLEEAAKEFVLSHDFSKLTNPNHLANRCFQLGAKWQQERMFELVEEYNQMLVDPNVHEDHKEKSFKDWFEQFKKK